MVADGGDHQHKHQHRRDGLERRNEQRAEDGQLGRHAGRRQGDDDAEHQGDGDLCNQAGALQPARNGREDHGL
ncbi:hypothetical protein SDC9_209866 [bioreactor metagenome]|uniref:Uncharacterized protein n=1 Tax=bioreactor metagenome TaxID=1076179 RepID=A0A645JHE7_9ZZZZ